MQCLLGIKSFGDFEPSRPWCMTHNCEADSAYCSGARIAELEAAIAPLLDHYIAAYDGGMDALAIKAAALVPDWKQRVEE